MTSLKKCHTEFHSFIIGMKLLYARNLMLYLKNVLFDRQIFSSGSSVTVTDIYVCLCTKCGIYTTT